MPSSTPVAESPSVAELDAVHRLYTIVYDRAERLADRLEGRWQEGSEEATFEEAGRLAWSAESLRVLNALMTSRIEELVRLGHTIGATAMPENEELAESKRLVNEWVGEDIA